MRNILKKFLPTLFSNLLYRVYIKIIKIYPKYLSSQNFWNDNIVDSPKTGFKSIKDSLSHLEWRNNQYIDSTKYILMDNLNNKTVLDYGCGPGNDLINISVLSKPKRLVAVDVSQEAIKRAQQRTNLHNLDVDFLKINENQKIHVIDDSSLDVIHSNGVLHHIENLEIVFNEFHRMLKDDGYAQIMVYNKESIWYHLHVAFEMKIKRNLFKGSKNEEIFRRSTDGFNCPVSVCYTPRNFINLCKRFNFNCELTGISISLFEMSKLSLIWEALKSQELEKESTDFLKEIRFNNRGLPVFKKNNAGINSYYKLTKF